MALYQRATLAQGDPSATGRLSNAPDAGLLSAVRRIKKKQTPHTGRGNAARPHTAFAI
jgi:hypothetical protein